MNCEQVCDKLLPLLSNELSPAQETELTDHICNCPECREHLEALRMAERGIRESLARRERLPSIADAVMVRLPVEPRSRAGRWKWVFAFGAAAALCLFVLISRPARIPRAHVEITRGSEPTQVRHRSDVTEAPLGSSSGMPSPGSQPGRTGEAASERKQPGKQATAKQAAGHLAGSVLGLLPSETTETRSMVTQADSGQCTQTSVAITVGGHVIAHRETKTILLPMPIDDNAVDAERPPLQVVVAKSTDGSEMADERTLAP